VNTKAELESSPLPPHQLDELEKGRVCFTCRKTKFSFFGPWSTACKLCKRLVCTRCVYKVRVPTEHFDSVPVYTLSPLSPDEIKEILLPYDSTGSEPGTPLLTRRESRDLRHLKPPKMVRSMMAERRAEKRKEDWERKVHMMDSKTSEDLEADEILRQVLGEDELDCEDLLSSSTGNWQQSRGDPDHFSISIHGQIRDHRKKEDTTPQDPPMVKLTLKQRLERAKHILGHDPHKAVQGPLMNICSDCKSMVCNIIRASRAMLAISQRGLQAHLPEASDRPGMTRHPRQTTTHNTAEGKKHFTLNLHPIY